jgi:type II secretory pathway component GspD/PulD (secretin)
MKAKLATLTFTGLFVCSLATAQTNPPAADQPAANPPGDTPSASPAQPGGIVPLIDIRDTALTAVIEALARDAGINYIMDPRVVFGQPGPDGKPAAPPSITIRWENITAAQALMAVLNNYGLQLIDDPKTKIARITVRDPAAPPLLITRIIQLKYASPSNIVAAVQTVLLDKRSKVVPDLRTSQLVISATEGELDAVEALIVRLDTATKQVLIEAKLVETSKSPTTSKGMDWSGTLAAQNISYGNGVVQPTVSTFTAPGTPTTTTLPGGRTITTTAGSSTTTESPPNGAAQVPSTTTLTGGLIPNGMSLNTLSGLTPNIGFLNADGLHNVLSFLNSDADAQVLSTPRAVTLDNQEAVLSVSRAYPVFATTAGTQGSPGGSQVTYTNLGTILHVTPRISANDFINLKVTPEVSSLGPLYTKIVAGVENQADSFDIRTIRTEVMIPSGNTLVLGGLVSDDLNNGYTKVPVLGDIPVLGWAFRYESKTQTKKNLLIFITPTIVKDTDYQPNQTDFLKTKPGEEMKGIDMNSVWDSAYAHDWSKPAPAEPVFTEPAAAPKSP